MKKKTKQVKSNKTIAEYKIEYFVQFDLRFTTKNKNPLSFVVYLCGSE